MLGARPVDSPIEQDHGMSGDSGELLNDIRPHQRFVGQLLYLTITRPDIAYVIGLVSQFMHVARIGHLNAVYRISKYLKKSPRRDLKISYESHQDKVFVLLDVDI